MVQVKIYNRPASSALDSISRIVGQIGGENKYLALLWHEMAPIQAGHQGPVRESTIGGRGWHAWPGDDAVCWPQWTGRLSWPDVRSNHLFIQRLWHWWRHARQRACCDVVTLNKAGHTITRSCLYSGQDLEKIPWYSIIVFIYCILFIVEQAHKHREKSNHSQINCWN